MKPQTSDATHGGGRVAAVVVSPFVKKQYQSGTFFQHESTLRLLLKSLGVTTYPGASANAPEMDEFLPSKLQCWVAVTKQVLLALISTCQSQLSFWIM